MDKNQEKIIKLLNLTTSDNDNESLSALRLANKLLRKSNTSWDQFFSPTSSYQSHDYSSYHRENSVENFEMTFGKYKGYSLREIFKLNPSYLDWASKNFDGFAGEKIRDFLFEEYN